MDETSNSLPYKVVDFSRQTKYGIVASSFQDLINKASEKFSTSFSKVVLEEDGTVTDEEYFETLAPNTCLMVLKENEEWLPVSHRSSFQNFENQDLTDGVNHPRLAEILARVRNDISYLLLLRLNELELLSEMDIDSFGDIPDRKFLEKIQEASIRFLIDKRDAKDSLDALRFLKTYYTENFDPTDTSASNKGE